MFVVQFLSVPVVCCFLSPLPSIMTLKATYPTVMLHYVKRCKRRVWIFSFHFHQRATITAKCSAKLILYGKCNMISRRGEAASAVSQ